MTVERQQGGSREAVSKRQQGGSREKAVRQQRGSMVAVGSHQCELILSYKLARAGRFRDWIQTRNLAAECDLFPFSHTLFIIIMTR